MGKSQKVPWVLSPTNLRRRARVLGTGSDLLQKWWLNTRSAKSSGANEWPSTRASISPDGTLVASTGVDGLLRLWNASNADLVRTLRQDRLYERLDITGIQGLTQAQKEALLALGAVEAGR